MMDALVYEQLLLVTPDWLFDAIKITLDGSIVFSNVLCCTGAQYSQT